MSAQIQQLNDVRVGAGALLPRAERKTKFKEPFRFSHEDQFKELMLETLAHNASDVFIQPSRPVCARIFGRMYAITYRDVDDGEVRAMLKWAAGRDTALTDIVERKPVNGRYELFDPVAMTDTGARVRHGYRVNAVPILSEGALSAQIVIRAIPNEPPNAQDVGLSTEILQSCTPKDGLILVAGATGTGKTTTFAAIIRYILENETPIQGNFVTGEEPIEFRFDTIKSRHSVCVQTQIPEMMEDFYSFNREAMRRKPAGILIGELRDQQTIRSAVEASMTGHPVFGTVHANDCAAVMRRLISRFPESERGSAIFDIVDNMRLVMAQRLVPTIDGRLTAAREYLRFDNEIREELSELDQMGKVTQAVKALVVQRGHSFAKEGQRLLAEGRIHERVARELSHA